MISIRKKLSKLTVSELKSMAKNHNVSGYSSLNKNELIDELGKSISIFKLLDISEWIGILAIFVGIITLIVSIRSCSLDQDSLDQQILANNFNTKSSNISIQQGNPHPQHYNYSQIEIPYFITNNGDEVAKDVSLKLLLPDYAYVWFTSDDFKKVSGTNLLFISDSLINESEPKILEFTCPQISPNDVTIMYVSINKLHFTQANNMQPLKLNTPIPARDQQLPRILKFYDHTGNGDIKYLDSIKLINKDILPSRVILNRKLNNGFSLTSEELKIEFTINYIEDLIRNTEYVFDLLSIINDMLSEENSKDMPNEHFLLPELKFLEDFTNDTIVNDFVSQRFEIIAKETVELKAELDNLWNRDVNQKEIIREIIKVYFNQIELMRMLCNVESVWLKGDATQKEHDDAFDRYFVYNNVKNNLPLRRPIKFDESAFSWVPHDTLIEEYGMMNKMIIGRGKGDTDANNR